MGEGDAAAGAARVSLGPVVARLTGLNALLLLVTLVTAPVQARVLGADGRGEIAVILTVLTLAPILLDFGLSDFVARERARGTRFGVVLGTTLPLALGFALVGALLAVPVSELLGQGRPVVERFVRIVMLAMPIWVMGWMLLGAVRGEQRWSIIYWQRGLTVVGTGAAVVGLALLGLLTVESLAIATLAVALPGIAVTLPILRGTRNWRFDRALVAPALAFGGRSWLTQISSQGNYRLDQIMMAALVPSSELGIYAVAVGYTSVLSSFASAVSLSLMPRVAQEGGESVPRVVRTSALALVSGLTAIALLAPIVVPLLFGPEFEGAVPVVAVLVVGALCIGVSLILGAALQGHGRPQDAMRPQLVGLGITVVGLLLVLGPLGAIGAALVSAVSCAAVLTGTLRAAAREFEVSAATLIVPRPEDVRRLLRAVPRPLWRR